MSKIKVLIIDDSALIRKLLTELLSSDKRIDVVGTASDPFVARKKIKELRPDVLTLDIEMPNMDGLTFLKNLMRLHPLPVVMVSTLTEKGNEITLDALELGAIDFVTKPKIDVEDTIQQYKKELIEKIIVASKSNLKPSVKTDVKDFYENNKEKNNRIFQNEQQIIGIGASTGGTEAIKEIITHLPVDMPGIVISQHIPPDFSRSFAKRMDTLSKIKVCEAEDGQEILPGHAYIAPGDKHLKTIRNGKRLIVSLDDGPKVNRHKPSVEVMFNSIAENIGANAIGIILTGMGADGAIGLKNMHSSGAFTIAQDESSSIVWGMPGEAVKLGAASSILPLSRISYQLVKINKVA